ncbi:DUF4386 domain-containing protein [Cytobacillus sp. IB215665]|uniref:DUF4386 domain-containing protein n=1 Tax=Cytobacillus sp. IB215665 TaxID=3097357 RepID=UPI002A10A1D9|nr:DUF4386 domain-containing protein [Cytobacillus sp. IB215665]MDX8363576.1 DUF4386 domain-containing protein [Cytobacillus sp. IB215665]
MEVLQQDVNQLRKSALIAGISLIIMTVAAFFSFGYVHSSLMISNSSIETFNNISASTGLFRAGILGWLVILITDILVSWAFYIFLKPIHEGLATLAAWLRLMYTAILAIAVSNLIQVDNLIKYSNELLNQPDSLLASEVMMSVLAFESVWSFGLIVFGMHLLIVGFVVSKTKTVPKIISVLLVLGGASYMLVHLLDGFFPTLENVTSTIEMILMIPMTAGELGFCIWLLVKGGKTPIKSYSTRKTHNKAAQI